MQVWSHSQGIYNLRTDLALVLEIPEHAIQVHHIPGSGSYGHNGADDVAFDAAWLSRCAPGKHVRVQWTRRDEFCWAPQSPPMAINIQADTDSRGTIIDWRHTVWGPGHSLRPGRAATSTLLGSWYQQIPQPVIAATNAPLAAGGGSERNMLPCYDINCSTIDAHRILTMPIRTSSLRSLGALANVFAIESMLDDIAHEHLLDPITYRLEILADSRGRKVLQAVHELSAWKDASNGSNHANDSLQGLGVGYAQYKNKGAYCAVVAKVSISHEVRVEALYVAVDVGEVINPDGVRNQIEGGAVQATSMALLEQARFDAFGLTDTTWNEYPILRFSQAPAVHVEIINNPGHAPVGAGEASLGPTVAAIGNAIRAATGARLRSLPFSFDTLSQAI
jgi:CO/xanthine dehydrogenase Mo-binding subunit